MTEQSNTISGVPMIRIDGARVKRLREELGLTQLYLATAVEVTTDTISRWENRHYPTIKRENGLRLAEALEVALDEILEKPASEEEATEDTSLSESPPSSTRAGVSLKTYNRLLNTALAVMIPVVIGLVIWNKTQTSSDSDLSAIRSLPTACAAGLQFPVAITVKSSNRDLPLLIRETVPEGLEIIRTMPEVPVQNARILKWIRREGGEQMVSGYLARAAGAAGSVMEFSGDVAVRQGKKQEFPVSGDASLRLAPVHWADIDGDYIISDDEVLEAYDKFGKLSGLARELDQVEEIWMGSGYRWDAQTKTITILP